jgi:adenylate kinase family enzyme
MAKERMSIGAILLMGVPGVGKGTQAFKLTEVLPNFVHFDTGAEIYRRIYDPDFALDPLVQEQKKLYESGALNDPRWVTELATERIRYYAKQGKGVIFSGSPRTLYEATVLMPLLAEIYGGNVLVLILSADEETARKRSLNRLVCANKECRFPTTKDRAGKRCPQCGKKLPKADEQGKESWKVEKIAERFKEFRERTLPVFSYLLSLELAETVNAERTEEEIFADIFEAVKRRFS